MPSAMSLSRAWLNLSSAPFCDGFVPSHDSSSKSTPLESLSASLMWHLIVAAISFERFLPTVSSHFRTFFESVPSGIFPASSPPGSMSFVPWQ